jgi:hypothetical protein
MRRWLRRLDYAAHILANWIAVWFWVLVGSIIGTWI